MKINTGDTIIDAVLQQKYREAQKNETILEIGGKFVGIILLKHPKIIRRNMVLG